MTAAPLWHLLLCGPGWPPQAPTPAAARADVIAMHYLDGPGCELVLHRLGLNAQHQAMFLIRPDGHIGLRTNGTELEPLASYLDHWLAGPG